VARNSLRQSLALPIRTNRYLGSLCSRCGLIVKKKQSETYMEVPRNSGLLRRSWARSSARNLRA
jgi:hypothetical protein